MLPLITWSTAPSHAPPCAGSIGLSVIVPTAEYMLALKLKAMRTLDAAKGAKETDDIFQLMRVIGIDTADQAMQILARYFPTSAQDTAKQRLLLKPPVEPLR